MPTGTCCQKYTNKNTHSNFVYVNNCCNPYVLPCNKKFKKKACQKCCTIQVSQKYRRPTTCCNKFANPCNSARQYDKWIPKCNMFADPCNRADANVLICGCCYKGPCCSKC